MSMDAHNKCLHALQENGMCIIHGLFEKNKEVIHDLGLQALRDLELAMIKLKERNIDLLQPGTSFIVKLLN